MGKPILHRHYSEKRYRGGNDARGLGEHELRCGHRTRGNVVVSVAGPDRTNDRYWCPQGCGLQRRRK